jgi:hypothetical protein
MSRLLLLVLLLCGFTGSPGTNPNPLSFWWYGDDPTVESPLECALARVRAATCLPVDVSFDAAHWVRRRAAADMGGRAGWTTGSWTAADVKISDSLAASQRCPVLTHEIVHILRRSNAHPGPDGSMTFPVVHTHVPASRITAEDIAEICAVQTCGCANPE